MLNGSDPKVKISDKHVRLHLLRRFFVQSIQPFSKGRITFDYAIAGGNISEEQKITRLSAMVYHSLFFALIILVLLILYVILPSAGFVPFNRRGHFDLAFIEFCSYIASLIIVIVGGLWPKFAKLSWFDEVPYRGLFTSHIHRIGLFGSIILFGLILGIFGSSWWVLAPHLLIGAIMLFLTFPTKKRWSEWQHSN